MRLTIRTARGDDWEDMREIHVQAGREAWGHILSETALASLSAPNHWHPDAGADVLVAECAGRVIGFICIRASADKDADPTVGEISAFYVHPSRWGIGAGQALLSAAVERAAAIGFKEVTLWTEHRNYRPLKFYREAGWTLDGARRYASGGSEIIELRHRLRTSRNTPEPLGRFG